MLFQWFQSPEPEKTACFSSLQAQWNSIRSSKTADNRRWYFAMEYSCKRHVLKIFQPSGKFMCHVRRIFQILGFYWQVFDIADQNGTCFFTTKCKHELWIVACLPSSELEGEKLRPFTVTMEDASRSWMGEKASMCPLWAFQNVLNFLDLSRLLLCKPQDSHIFRLVCLQGASLI